MLANELIDRLVEMDLAEIHPPHPEDEEGEIGPQAEHDWNENGF